MIRHHEHSAERKACGDSVHFSLNQYGHDFKTQFFTFYIFLNRVASKYRFRDFLKKNHVTELRLRLTIDGV